MCGKARPSNFGTFIIATSATSACCMVNVARPCYACCMVNVARPCYGSNYSNAIKGEIIVCNV